MQYNIIESTSECINYNVNIIEDVRMAKMPPCDMLALTAWDQRYSTTLPDSIRDFYLARSSESLQLLSSSSL